MSAELLTQGGFLAVAAYAVVQFGRLVPAIASLAKAASVWFVGQEQLRVATLEHYVSAAKWAEAEEDRHEALLGALSGRQVHA